MRFLLHKAFIKIIVHKQKFTRYIMFFIKNFESRKTKYQLKRFFVVKFGKMYTLNK